MSFPDLAGFLITGVLSGLLAGLFGVGGGVIVVPALILLFGHLGVGGDWVAHLAVGSSLAAIVGTGAASALAHHRRGGVRWELALRLAPGIVLGAWLGA
ncbi:MAG: TSUP family transporter, partial [Chromatiaceae bacterium]